MHVRFSILLLVALTAVSMAGRPAALCAQDEDAQAESAEKEEAAVPEPQRFRLPECDPFDRLTLADGQVVRILPQEFPGGRKPENPKPTDRLRIELVSQPGQKFNVYWKDIERYEQFQEMVLEDAQALTALGQYDRAWDHFFFLRRRYPQTPGLERAIQDFLFANAGALYREYGRSKELSKLERALAILEELYQTNPQYPRAAAGLSAAAGELLRVYIDEQQNYRVARQLLQRLDEAYGAAVRSALATARDRLIALAAEQKNLAQSRVAMGDFVAAYEALREMRRIWPDLEGGAELTADVARRYPMVVVGIEQPATTFDPRSLDNWAARRSGRLLHRTLIEYERHGPEGGDYRFPLGQYLRTDDDLQLRFRVNPVFLEGPIVLTGYDVARTLAALADPRDERYLPAWGRLAGEIAVEGVTSVVVELRRPHVRPEAFLQTRFDALGGPSEGDPFTPFRTIPSPHPEETHYVRNENYAFRGPAQPAVVVERRFDRSSRAVRALLDGEIDILDRVYPADVPRLQARRELTVNRYDAPTIHLLVPNDKNPFLANRDFRRAIQLGVARETILNTVLLEGAQVPGCRVVSGPFPAGVGTNDPQAYGYDFSLAPRPWNPQHALVLKALGVRVAIKRAEDEAKKAQEAEQPTDQPPVDQPPGASPRLAEAAAEAESPPGEKDPKPQAAPPALKLEPLKLVHPATELARRACQAMQAQLRQIQIETTLVELPPGQVRPEDDDFDLLYAEVCVTEPLVDARRILGEGGVAKITNPYIRQALRDLDAAASWRDARARLIELHDRVHTELTVIPLWQLIDYYACRSHVQTAPPSPALLYQDMEQWRVEPRGFAE